MIIASFSGIIVNGNVCIILLPGIHKTGILETDHSLKCPMEMFWPIDQNRSHKNNPSDSMPHPANRIFKYNPPSPRHPVPG
jgi:hypothetical protein